MQLNQSKFALSGGLTMAVLGLVCILLSLWAPELLLKISNSMVHLLDLDLIARGAQITLLGSISVLVQSFIYAYIFFYLFAWIYNKLTRRVQ